MLRSPHFLYPTGSIFVQADPKKTSRSPVDGSGPWFPDVTIFTNRIKKIVNFLKIITFLKIVIIIGTDKIIGMMIHCL